METVPISPNSSEIGETEHAGDASGNAEMEEDVNQKYAQLGDPIVGKNGRLLIGDQGESV